MRHKKLIFLVPLLLGAGLLVYWVSRPATTSEDLEPVLHGNVEQRQVSLSFNNTERISEVLVEEGDLVRRGQVLARVDTSRLRVLLEQAEAQAAALGQGLARLRNGSRPEEVGLAEANLAAATAEARDAALRRERLESLRGSTGVSIQDLDTVQAAALAAQARREAALRTLELVRAGPRAEELAQAEHQLQAAQAQAAYLHCQLADSELAAPMDAVVRTRVLEPGEMASPQRSVLVLALRNPKWIRSHVAEALLGRITTGQSVTITSDSFPGKGVSGRISFISPTAEFTPKALQSEELRSHLVYEIRVLTEDPADELRLGMPVTLKLEPRGTR